MCASLSQRFTRRYAERDSSRDGGVGSRLERFDVTSSLTSRVRNLTPDRLYLLVVSVHGSRSALPYHVNLEIRPENLLKRGGCAASQRVAARGSDVSPQAARILQQVLIPDLIQGSF